MRRANVLLSQAISVPPSIGFVETHEVFNQVPLFENYNAYSLNKRLAEAFKHYTQGFSDAQAAEQKLSAYGEAVGNGENLRQAQIANAIVPVFTPFDRHGRRVNGVTFSDAYHHTLRLARQHEVPSYMWARTLGGAEPTERSATMARAVLSYLHYQLEGGTGCPLTMTFAAVPCLLDNTGPNHVAAGAFGGDFTEWIHKLSVGEYDPRDQHISQKRSVMIGMSMTEKQGGSDVRSNTTTATPVASSDASGPNPAGYQLFKLRGHKWFTSAPMCDAFLTLANTDKGPTCFLVPRWLTPELRNHGLRFQQLKNKLGDKSNASSEVEYHDAIGYAIGVAGQGVKTIISMVNHTRLDCLIGSAGLMAVSLLSAVNHAKHRSAFGKLLVEQPAMRSVLCDLALESEAATALAMRISSSFDRHPAMNDPTGLSQAFQRVACAIGKYHVCKTAPNFVYECLECHGGNGYVEDFPMARHYRQAPLNPIWEGSGNVIVLDLFRAVQKEPLAVQALAAEVKRSGDAVLSKAFSETLHDMTRASPEVAIAQGRLTIERLAMILQGCALRQFGPAFIADWFIASRIAHHHGRHYGAIASPQDDSWVPQLLARYL